MAPGERQLGFLKADSPLAFQEQGPTSSIIQHTLPHCSLQQDCTVVCGRVCQTKIKLLFVQDKCKKRKESRLLAVCMHTYKVRSL